ncbi:hypothetical protein EOI86_06680 [Hwanghaeella grinnelliae]|uniref:DUF1624 domain-containing protein n=1 Tax=Hwanghaeella grinnelliae TaxID=2500179 RepID=A0A437QWM9_9PROT|nr:OpgC domain-containing protein [Hwanghaeella grinnelliae]RVU38944.1 hypothetical protein EOI86_06680 [Hwanghaeella grinnelliae]
MRFDLVDGIRGHLLIGMLVAHLSFHPGMGWLLHFHHHALFKVFDAEFFVVIAGFLVGFLASEKIGAKPATRWELAQYLGRRTMTVYAYFTLAGFALLMLLGEGAYSWHGALSTAADVLIFQNGPRFGGILGLYILCFLLLLAAVLVLGVRPLGLLALSAGLYLLSQFSYMRGLWGIGGDIMAFDVAAWQFPFIASFALGFHRKAVGRAIDRLPEPVALAAVVGLFCASLVLAKFWITPPFAEVPPEMPRHWPRPQLHPYHLLKTLVLALAVTIVLVGGHRLLAWPRAVAAGYFRLGFLRAIGKYSIRMFTLHLILVSLFAYSVDRLTQGEKTALAFFMLAVFIAAPSVVTAIGRGYGKRGKQTEIRP